MKKRSLLTLDEFSAEELNALVKQALICKQEKNARIFPERLKHRNICGIFLKPSGRTSTSFVVASSDEGAHFQFFPAENVRFGHKESVKDFARLLGRLFDGIAFRGFDHRVAEELASYSGIPVWNGLTDQHHPTQVLADVMTIVEEFDCVQGIKIAYVGDGRNNMVNSLIIGAMKFGYELHIISPESLLPDNSLLESLASTSSTKLGRVHTSTELSSVKDADVIYTDVWISMGEEKYTEERIRLLKDYKITQRLMQRSENPSTIFLHCLPSFHDLDTEVSRQHPDIIEVDDDVFNGPQSRVFQQAENRMHTIKALMIATI